MKIVIAVYVMSVILSSPCWSSAEETAATHLTSNDLHKIERTYQVRGYRIRTNDVQKLEKKYRDMGESNGIFNVPEWFREDEWDGGGCQYAVANRAGNGELVPRPKRDIVWDRVQARPYIAQLSWRNWTTLGQLCKLSDGVFLGVISKITGLTEKEKEDLPRGLVNPDHPATITFEVKTNLFGWVSGHSTTIPVVWLEGEKNHPRIGMKVLFFYARGYTFSILADREQSRAPLYFDWKKPPEDPDIQPHVPVKNGSNVRILNSPEIEKAYIEAVDGYLRLLRRENRDPDKYYEFLRTLVKSPVWRIRQDAKEDLLRLFGPFGPERFDLKRVPDDPELDWDLGKDYVRYIAIPDREKRKIEIKETK